MINITNVADDNLASSDLGANELFLRLRENIGFSKFSLLGCQ